MFEGLRTGKDGIQYFRAEYWIKEDSYLKDFGKYLNQICEPISKPKEARELVAKSIADLVLWLWSDYALLPKHHFVCLHPYDKDGESFFLGAFEDEFDDELSEFLRHRVGIPMWAELSIEDVDTSDANYDRGLEDYWGIRNFVNGWGKSQFLEKDGSALALIYASENAADGDLEYNPKLGNVYIHIIQSDPNWYHDQWTYYNWLDFNVTVDKKEIDRHNKLIGASYGTLTDEQRANLVLAAIDAMEIEELEKNKVPQYLLSLLLNHPQTSDEAKTQIVLIADEHIIKLKD